MLLARFRQLVFGTATGQLITVAATPVLTRIYSVEAFGLFALCMVAVNLLRNIANLRYERAIYLPRSSRQAFSIFLLCIVVCFSLGLLVFITSYLSSLWFNENGVLEIGSGIAIALILIGLLNAQQEYLNRLDKQKTIARVRILEATVVVLAQVLLSMTNEKYGLVLGLAGGLVIANLAYMTELVSFRVNKKAWAHIRLIPKVAYRYRGFPLINVWSAILDVLGNRLVLILLSFLYSNQIVGFFGLCHRVLSGPSALIGQAAAMSFLRTASDESGNNSHHKLIIQNLSYLFILGGPFFIVITIYGAEIFPFIFGEDWILSGEFAQILAPMLLLRFCIFPIVNLAAILERHHVLVAWSSLKVVLPAASILGAFYILNDIYVVITVYSFAQALVFIVLLRWALLQKDILSRRRPIVQPPRIPR